MNVSGNLPEVTADHERILQVYINLLGNALQYTALGGVASVPERRAATCRKLCGSPSPTRALESLLTTSLGCLNGFTESKNPDHARQEEAGSASQLPRT